MRTKKLSEQEILEILISLTEGKSVEELAVKYKVSTTTIRRYAYEGVKKGILIKQPVFYKFAKEGENNEESRLEKNIDEIDD